MHRDLPIFQQAYNVLKHANLFASLDPQILKDMIKECTPVHWKKADTIDSGIGTKYLIIIISGRLKITQIDPVTGRSIALFLLHEGDIFDVISLLDGKEHIVFPVAVDDVLALRMPIDRGREWICEYPEFNKAFLPYLGEHMRTLESFGESMVFHDTATRLARLILKHAAPKENEKEPYYPVKLINNLSHESLSELIGSVRSVVSTQMRKLKEDETIISTRGHLAIKDLEELIKKCDLFDHTFDKKI